MATSETAAGRAGGPGTEGSGAAAAGQAAAVSSPPPRRQRFVERGGNVPIALAFLVPALLLLAALVVYPTGFTLLRSLFDASGDGFVGLGNYQEVFTSERTLTALGNTVLWVLVAPTVVTALGLVFAVLTERVRWATAFKLVVFMPMAISFLAAGIIFRLVYEDDPQRGVLNAAVTGVSDVFDTASAYPGARPREGAPLAAEAGGFTTTARFSPGDVATLPLVAIAPDAVPGEAEPAAEPAGAPGALSGLVWLDFTRGGGGEPGAIDDTEQGLPGLTVQAVRDGAVVATTETDERGAFAFEELAPGSYTLALPAENFREPFRGFTWLGPALATWAIIGAYVWMWAGFAMVLIAAGLAAISREALEAARVDGATEWQVFRRVTIPLLAPVLVVVLVTLTINVLKVFDLVFVLAPDSVQDDANVLALEMWRVSFGGGQDQGLGSALGVLLFGLVVPAMIFNIRRFRQEQR
jgi:alpha-glucoside transport system permease protein